MKLRYEITVEDFVAFNRHHCEHSPTARRIMNFWRIYVPVAVLLIFAILSILQNALSLFLVGFVPALYFVAVMPWAIRRNRDSMARRMYAEGANKAAICSHELELSEEILVGRSHYGDSTVRLEAVERVVTIADYTFVYLGAISAIVVPRHAVSEGDYDAFVAALRQAVSDHRGSDPQGGNP